MGVRGQQRAVRQLALGLIPVVLLAGAVLAGLAVRGTQLSDRLAGADRRATGTVTAVDAAGHAQVRWVESGRRRSSAVDFPRSAHPAVGARVTVHYRPGGKTVHVPGDSASARADDLADGVLYTAALLAVVLATTAIRVVRRRRVDRRPGAPVRVSRVRTRLGLLQRSWLVVAQGGREHWVPVFWAPPLSGLLAETPGTVRGTLRGGGLVGVEVAGVRLWASGRVRTRPPRGRLLTNPGTHGRGEPGPAGTASLVTQARRDVVLVLPAPVLGLLWAYLNGLGAVGFGLATAVLAGVLFWIPSSYGSDPS